MPFDDDSRAVEPARPTHLLFRCARCGETVAEAHPDCGVALRRAIEHGHMATIHVCPDGADGVAELIGTGPGVWKHAPKDTAA
jgi:predicted RNA-binding Zn-ribbon protein involved in translation (DUF1610 family)